MTRDELEFSFEHEGRTVTPGAVLYVHSDYHWLAGPRGRVERYHGDQVTLRTCNGAVPVLPLSALSWAPHPETLAMEEMAAAGVANPSRRDVAVWMLGRGALPRSGCVTPDLERRIRLAINPAYADTPGTESHERAALLGEIDRLRALVNAYK
ncbi:MAG: hypothetical protein RLZZ373_3222 [Pseudomonadota bacterium]|jgi:hypothetical protein